MTADARIGVWHRRPTIRISFFAIEIIGFSSFHDDLIASICRHSPFAAVGIVTGITGGTAAARIIGNDIVNKILITGVAQLVRFAGLKQKRVARTDFSESILVSHAAAPGDDEVKFRLRRVRVIRAKCVALGDPHISLLAIFAPAPGCLLDLLCAHH